MEINGIILVNKESGFSSNQVVGKVKYLLKANKAGHLGTLDVLGRGLLPITLGRGTKLFDYFLNKDKVYQTIFEFGFATTTLDREGEITDKNDVEVSLEQLQNVCQKFIGKQDQLPPIYSAKKINGKKAYELARAGKSVDLKPKQIEIYDLKVLKQIEKNKFLLEVHCSSGTYIRSLCRDIASSLSTFGVMQDILRTKCGSFDIKKSFTIEDIEQGKYKIIPLDTVFDYEKLITYEADKLLNGQLVNTDYQDGIYRIYTDNYLFLGIGNVKNKRLKLDMRLI